MYATGEANNPNQFQQIAEMVWKKWNDIQWGKCKMGCHAVFIRCIHAG